MIVDFLFPNSLDYILDVLREENKVILPVKYAKDIILTILVDDAKAAADLVARYAAVVTSITVRLK